MANFVDPNAIVQSVEISDDDLKFITPFTMCVSGASMVHSMKNVFLDNRI